MSDIDTIREALQWIISKSRSLGEYHSTLDPETAHGLIVEIPHECNEALAALDRIQAQRQSNAEPVAWMLKREDPLAPSLFTKWEVMRSPRFRRNKEEEFIPLYAHPPASTEPRLTVDGLANEIRTVDGSNSLGAGALAEALMPYLTKAAKP